MRRNGTSGGAVTRRLFVAGCSVVASAPAWAQSIAGSARPETPQGRFTYEDVVARAERLANAPFDDAAPPLPEALVDLDYDQYRRIRYREDARLPLGDGPFKLDMFHLGHLFTRPVGVNILRDGVPERVPYLANEFDYDGLDLGPFPESLGFAGIRMRTTLNRPDVFDELLVFLGSSYFRFLGRGQRYGLSARAFAINAGVPMEEEEFPFFREFWIEATRPGQQHLTLYGLLDSPSLAGAFSFEVHPGDETLIDTVATIIPRTRVTTAGVAPLTSMFYTGSSSPRAPDLFRGEVHDSGGLLFRRGASVDPSAPVLPEWTWRPLANPPENRLTHHRVASPKGFGLLQRIRAFDAYQDLEAHYELRPSYWVIPAHDWGPGSIELAELETPTETNDNIVASFKPEAALEPLTKTSWSYRILSLGDGSQLHDLARAQRTLAGDVAHDGIEDPGERIFVIDFAGGDAAFYKDALAEIELVLTRSDGKPLAGELVYNRHMPGLRAKFTAPLDAGESVTLSAVLRHKGKPFSETWTYLWSRPAV